MYTQLAFKWCMRPLCAVGKLSSTKVGFGRSTVSPTSCYYKSHSVNETLGLSVTESFSASYSRLTALRLIAMIRDGYPFSNNHFTKLGVFDKPKAMVIPCFREKSFKARWKYYVFLGFATCTNHFSLMQ